MHYVDTSALVKLIVLEADSDPMRAWSSDDGVVLVTSDLTRTELMRAALRVHPSRARRVREVLDAVDVVRVTTRAFDDAGRLDPRSLRSLDAIHLAVALTFGDDLESVVTYDARLASAAAAAGVAVTTPSA